MARFDRTRKKKGSNDDWTHPQDPDAKITRMKDGRTHLAHTAEQAVDLETGAVVAVTVQDADAGDTTTMVATVIMAAEQIENGVNAMFLAAADGSGPAEHLLTVDDALALHAYSWSPDGNSLVFEYSTIDTLGDIGVVSLSDALRWKPLIQTPASERAPAVSPDGRWIAYHSDGSGPQEIFIERFPGGGSRRPISTSGGMQPMWSQDGRELLYREA